jgi:GNAT superfamily N-acetyltransferase
MPTIRLLGKSDLPAAMQLKTYAGWNQTEDDWRRLLDLAPDGCFCVETGGEVAAAATVLPFGADLAWIGMVLTAPQFRGRGYARCLMERTIEYGRERAIHNLGLDATDMGLPLYRSLGFEDVALVERWKRLPGPGPVSAPAVGPWGSDPALDRRAFGADRSFLLANLARAEAASVRGGYAMGRPGSQAAYFGPCVSLTADIARDLLSWFVARHAAEPIYWDLLPDNHDAVALARNFGFTPVRRLTRMVRILQPSDHPRPEVPLVYAIAGFELG